MKKYVVAILGATGAVGQEMIKELEERAFPVSELRLLASPRSVGKVMYFHHQEVKVQLACDEAFNGCDIVLGAVENDISKKLAPAIKAANALYIDNSSAFRLYDDVPLVVPEVNGEDVKKHNGIIANPNCSTIIACTAVNAIHKAVGIKTMIASTYQAVSGAGVGGMRELEQQVQAISEKKPIEIRTFPYQIAYNLIPQIGSGLDNDYTTEEMKMQNEGRRIFHAPDLLVNCTCIRVPVMRSHSISITLIPEKPIDIETVKNLISHAEGCKLVDDLPNKQYPMPLDTSNQDLVYVGRIRKDITSETGITLWCCGDQIRKGAAGNAVQIAQECVKYNIL